MRIAVITVAGISSRFNKDIPDKDKVLKCIYYEENPQNTLINHLIEKVSSYDRIILVGGFKFSDLISYIDKNAAHELKDKIMLIKNDHFDDLSSGYSLYLGIEEALNRCEDIQEVLFVEGDLDIDNKSLSDVVNSDKNVLTFNYEPIYSNKSVVLYQNANNDYKYLFNSDHGTLTIAEEFKAIFNSGQVWKFKDMELLEIANRNFKENLIEDTNLAIIQKYFDLVDNDEIEIIGLKHWINCNTRDDYKIINESWSK